MIQAIGDRLRKALGQLFQWQLRASSRYRAPLRGTLVAVGLERSALSSELARRLLLTKDEPRYSRILESRPHPVEQDSDIELHMLVRESDFLRAVWALKSFFHFSRLSPRLMIHNDGTLTEASLERFREHFPGCEIPEDAEATTIERLADYPMCRFFRSRHPISGKLLDVLLYSRAAYLIAMDSDVLWYRDSPPITGCTQSGVPFYVRGDRNAYARSRGFMERQSGLYPADRLNAGLIGFARQPFVDFDFIEHALDKLINVPPELVPESLAGWTAIPASARRQRDPVETAVWWVMEQTIYALLFGRRADAVALNPNGSGGVNGSIAHPFVNAPITPNTAAQHFISDSNWNAFFPVGVEHLLRSGFLDAWDEAHR